MTPLTVSVTVTVRVSSEHEAIRSGLLYPRSQLGETPFSGVSFSRLQPGRQFGGFAAVDAGAFEIVYFFLTTTAHRQFSAPDGDFVARALHCCSRSRVLIAVTAAGSHGIGRGVHTEATAGKIATTMAKTAQQSFDLIDPQTTFPLCVQRNSRSAGARLPAWPEHVYAPTA
jgi:hypothetical protein